MTPIRSNTPSAANTMFAVQNRPINKHAGSRNPSSLNRNSSEAANQRQKASLVPLSDKNAVIDVVENLLAGRPSRFELVSPDVMTNYQRLRSGYNKGFHFLCHANTKRHTGWLVCNFALSQHCALRSAVKKFDTETGTATLCNHLKAHNSSSKKLIETAHTKIGNGAKGEIVNAAAYAVVQGLLPLSFLSKPGMTRLADAFMSAGRSLPVSAKIDVANAIPSTTCVRNGVQRMAQKARDTFKASNLPVILEQGGGVTSDGLKQKVQGKKYYDFTVHFFDVGKKDILTGISNVRLCSHVLFLKRHEGNESAEALRSLFDQSLLDVAGVDLDCFMQNFTFVTDCASTMPCIVGASSSCRKVPFNEKWLGCISHQLNTAMKYIMDSECRKKTAFTTDLENLKTIVRVFKQGDWNALLPKGFDLLQEVDTRFGTTHTVVERFLKSADKVRALIASKDSESASRAFESTNSVLKPSGHSYFPFLDAIDVYFRPIRHMQTALEAHRTPTLHLVLPMLATFKRQLQNLRSGMAQGPEFSTPHPCTQEFAGFVVMELEKIEIHDLWVAGCVLHPRMKNLSFIHDLTVRDNLKEKGHSLIRRLSRKFSTTNNSDDLPAEHNIHSSRIRSIVPNALGAQCFRLEDVFDTPDSASADTDSLSKYLSRGFPSSATKLLQDDLGIAKFWISQQSVFPDLCNVALRLYATPVSSASSERNFNAVNRIITPDRSKLTPSILEDLLCAHSVVLNDVSLVDGLEKNDSDGSKLEDNLDLYH